MAAMGFSSGKYTEAKDKKKDAKMLKKAGFDKDEKAKFEKADKQHKKPKTMAEDKKADAKIIKGIKSKEKREERREKKEKK
jgi:hypothetical protein